MERIAEHYTDNVRWFDETLGAGRSCDMVCRDLEMGGRRGRIWVIDGFGGDAILERMGSFWLTLTPEQVGTVTQMQVFVDRFVTFMEVEVSFDREDIVTSVLLGKSLLLLEGVQGAALIDAKDYPSRGVAEPLDGKVLRGAHDGFIEAVVPNMALLRRRIRDPHLTMEGMKVGTRSHNDVVLCYLDDRVDRKLLEKVREKLRNIQMRSLSMGQESVAESIGKRLREHPAQTVVQPLSQGPLYGAARHRRRLRDGGLYHFDGGQLPFGDDSAHLLLRLHPGGQRVLLSASGGHVPAPAADHRLFDLPVHHSRLVYDGQRAGAAAGLADLSLLAGAGGPGPSVAAAGGGVPD